jgi:hypothetical protein
MEKLGGFVALVGIMIWGLLAVASLILEWREKRASPPLPSSQQSPPSNHARAV